MSQRRKKGSFKEIVADLFELPQEVLLDLPRVTLVGNVQLYIENHRGVISYDENQVCLSVKNGELIVRERLQIKNLLEEELSSRERSKVSPTTLSPRYRREAGVYNKMVEIFTRLCGHFPAGPGRGEAA